MDDEFFSRARRAFYTAGCFVVRHWPWFVGGAAVYFLFLGNWIGAGLGYERTDLSPGLRLFHDVAIAGIALFGLGMAFWRNFLLDRQSKAASDSAAHARERMENDQFKEAVELLAKEDKNGKAAIAARVGGIYILRDLALHEERWREFAPRAIRILVAYIKEDVHHNAHSREKSYTKGGTDLRMAALGEDVKAAFKVLENVIKKRGKALVEEKLISRGDLGFDYRNFSYLFLDSDTIPIWMRFGWVNVELKGVVCRNAKMTGASFILANFEGAILHYAMMQGTQFNLAKMKEAKMNNADLRGADMSKALLSSADFTGAKFNATDLRGATIDNAKFPPAKELHGRIWHSNQEELKGVKSRADDSDWGDVLREFSSNGFALAGLLRNYGDIGEPLTEQGRKLREAMINMLHENRMPKDFPFWAEEFLRGLNPNGTDKGNQDD